jgi:NAD(P)-dependent dehydrogenase (short-subunit alcohol dehydrogenase family)
MAREALVVTGASGALGTALVRAFVGAERVVVAIGRSLAQAELDREHGEGRVLAAAFDVRERTGWDALGERLERAGLTVSGAVLAAGAYRGDEPLHEAADADVFTAMLDANLATARSSLAALLPGMVTRGRGSVVAVGSVAAVRPWQSAGAAAYAASKAALLALAQAAAAEVLAQGVRINVLLPSTLDTPQNRASMPSADTSRWVTPASIAAVAAFLLSDAARDVSGAALPVYGRVTV